MHALLLVVLAMLPQSPATATVEGIVVAHSTGQPIPGAIVELTGIAAPAVGNAGLARPIVFDCDPRADGTFAITGVPPVSRTKSWRRALPTLLPQRKGSATPTISGFLFHSPQDNGLPEFASFFTRYPAFPARRRRRGKPRRNTRVTAVELRYSDSHRIFEDGVSAVTDAAGDFRIGGLRPGRYTIRARPQFSRKRSGQSTVGEGANGRCRSLYLFPWNSPSE
jgi:hypothetical protein